MRGQSLGLVISLDNTIDIGAGLYQMEPFAAIYQMQFHLNIRRLSEGTSGPQAVSTLDKSLLICSLPCPAQSLSFCWI